MKSADMNPGKQLIDVKGLVYFFEQLWMHSTDPFWVCKPVGDDFEVVMVNAAATRIDLRQVAGVSLRSIIGYGPESEPLIAGYFECMQTGLPISFEQRPVLDGSERLFETLLVPVKNDAGQIDYIWGTARNLTRFLVSQNALLQLNEQLEAKIRQRTEELEEANRTLSDLSSTDGLTGVANRRKFDAVMCEEWSRAARTGKPLALIMLDIDYFKKYNDHYGHQQGDSCLQRVAEVLRANVRRPGDLAARYGGEEFCLILPNAEPSSVAVIAENARCSLEALAMPHILSPFGQVTVSMGAAILSPSETNDPAALLRLADAALYRAKSDGRNCVRLAACGAN